MLRAHLAKAAGAIALAGNGRGIWLRFSRYDRTAAIDLLIYINRAGKGLEQRRESN
ncbi:hypothetical protein [Pseudaminobacter sp. NGMCC 1.201702]|uniref:hypothetical protein n=1 Tax=Pseudaminobacter sp. NGMCC 1.201702 TaxID=3391825 RepID=UPI0039EEE36D